MYARITPFKMKPGSKDDAVKIMNRVKADIMALPGLKHFINVMDDNGEGYVVSLTELSETPPDAQEKIKQIWSNFSHHLEAVPAAATYDVVADWKK